MRETPTHTLFISEVRAVTHVNRDILAATPVVLREFRRQFSRAANSVSEHSNIQDFSCGIGRPRRSATSPSILDRKPYHCSNDRNHDDGPHHRRRLLRTPASRRVVGSVIEFLTHPGALSASPIWLDVATLSEHRPHLVPKRRAFPVAVRSGR